MRREGTEGPVAVCLLEEWRASLDSLSNEKLFFFCFAFFSSLPQLLREQAVWVGRWKSKMLMVLFSITNVCPPMGWPGLILPHCGGFAVPDVSR